MDGENVGVLVVKEFTVGGQGSNDLEGGEGRGSNSGEDAERGDIAYSEVMKAGEVANRRVG